MEDNDKDVDNNKDNDNKKDDNNYNIRVSSLWDMIETWDFREDIRDINGINLMMMMTMTRMTVMRMTTRWRTRTRTMTTMTMVSQLWDWIEIWSFCGTPMT